MKKTKHFLLVAICMLFVTIGYAQHKRYTIKNGIGLQGGITQFDIITDNFETKKNNGFIGGMTASVDLPHRWFNVSYNIQLSENNIDINATPFGRYGEPEELLGVLVWLLSPSARFVTGTVIPIDGGFSSYSI